MEDNGGISVLSSTSETCTEQLQELTPKYNPSDNTEVKVPITPRYNEPQSSLTVLEASYMCSPEDSMNIDDDNGLTEQQLLQLTDYFNGLPRLMFKQALVKLYASCDRKLSEVRDDLFKLVSKMSGFPYVGSILKRRLQSRNGDSLVGKLALDIHTLIGIHQGEDMYSQEMKEMLSTSRRSRSASVPGPPPPDKVTTPIVGTKSIPHTSDILLKTELNDLSEIVQNITTDILGLKQIYRTNEKNRSTEISELKNTLSGIANSLSEFKRHFGATITSVQNCMQRIESMQSNSIVSLKNDMKVVKQDVKSCEDCLSQVENSVKTSIKSFDDKVCKLTAKSQKSQQQVSVLSSRVDTIDKVVSDSAHPRNCEVSTLFIAKPVNDACVQTDYSESLTYYKQTSDACVQTDDCSDSQSNYSFPGRPDNPNIFTSPARDSQGCGRSLSEFPQLQADPYSYRGHQSQDPGLPPGKKAMSSPKRTNYSTHDKIPDRLKGDDPIVMSVRPKRTGNSDTLPPRPTGDYRSSLLTEPPDYIPPPKTPQAAPSSSRPTQDLYQDIGFHIPTVITRDKTDANDNGRVPEQFDDLGEFVRKRTKRYYIGGFMPSITESKIHGYVTYKGPKVSKVTIFRNRLKPTVIRLNVEDDDNAHLVESEGFWPDGVVCRPWLTQTQYQSRFGNHSNQRRQRRNADVHQDDDDLADINPYACIRVDVD